MLCEKYSDRVGGLVLFPDLLSFQLWASAGRLPTPRHLLRAVLGPKEDTVPQSGKPGPLPRQTSGAKSGSKRGGSHEFRDPRIFKWPGRLAEGQRPKAKDQRVTSLP